MEPAGAIRGDKNIAHSPLYGSRSEPRRSGISAGGLVFPGIFFALPEQARLQGRVVLPPILWGAGPPQGKSGSGQKAGFRHAGLSGPVQGFCLYGSCLQERVWRPLSRTTRPCPPSAPGDPSRQQAARHAKRAPEDRGPCRLDLSGPQAWDVPVRAASRTGDQPAGRPARRAPGSCRCCDRW